MAKNDAVSVLHATLDYRRSIDVPGYDKIDLHPAARFIGTMNYGYAGTKELNEALVSRFLVIDMPAQTEESLKFIFQRMFPNIKENARTQFIGVFLDLQDVYKRQGVNTAETAATIATGKLGIFHGMKSDFCQDEYGQIAPVYSISAGLDYPGIGPEHAHLYLSLIHI